MEDDRQSGGGDQHAGRDTDLLRPRPDRAGGTLASDRDREHRDSRPRRVGDRQRDRVEPDVHARRLDGDHGQHGPGAGDEDEPEAGAEQEAAAEVSSRPAAEPGERPLEQQSELRDQQRRCEHEQQDEREVAEESLRQPELVEQPRGREREHREARGEAGDDGVRAARLVVRGAAGEEDRQDGEDARRDGRDHAREEADTEEKEHRFLLRLRGRLGCYAGSSGAGAGAAGASVVTGFRRRRLRGFDGAPFCAAVSGADPFCAARCSAV